MFTAISSFEILNGIENEVKQVNGDSIWLETEEIIGSTFYFTMPKLIN